MWGMIIGGLIWTVAFCWAILAFGWWVFPWLLGVFIEGWAITLALLGIIIICAIFLALLWVLMDNFLDY